MQKVLAEFSRLLENRFEHKIPTTEDSIRYTFFHALTTAGKVDPNDIFLEHPHEKISGIQVDTVISKFRENRWAVEFKYHRTPESNSTMPRPQHAGNLFEDIRRLVEFPGAHRTERMLVYVTDGVMAQYFRNERNRFGFFLTLPQNGSLRIDPTFITDKCKTFQSAVGGVFEAKIVCLLTRDFSSGQILRVYGVEPCLPPAKK